MGRSRLTYVAATAVALVLTGALGACGGGSSSSGAASDDAGTSAAVESTSAPVEPAALADSYVSTSVTGHDLVADTQIRLTFEDDNLTVNAGCNTMFAPYELTGNSLKWTGEPASTMMGCPEDLAAQDSWLADLFTNGVEVAAEGDDLTLAAGDVVIELSRAPMVDLQNVLNKTWRGVATIADGATSPIPDGSRRPNLVVGQNGLSRLSTGCNAGRTTVRVDETSINFGHPAVTRVACPEPERTIERRVLSVIDGRSDYVSFDGSVLIVIKGDVGLVFEVR